MPAHLHELLAAAADGRLGGTDCEELREGLLAQPSNAVSSGAFIVAAIVLWLRLPRQERWRLGGLYALLLAFIGIGSVIYHGPQVAGARQLHDFPIPVLIALAFVVLVVRWRRGEVLLPGRSRGRVVAFILVSVISPAAYFLGRTGAALCDPGSIYQPHAIWHLSTATGFALLGLMLFRAPADVSPAPPR